jgi:signal transduction histidine kinase
MEIIQQKIFHLQEKLKSFEIFETMDLVRQRSFSFFEKVKSVGFAPKMDDYEKRKLGIFNQLNFFQLVTGTLGPVLGLFQHQDLPSAAWLAACLPALISILVLYLNRQQKYEAAVLCYFILYPFITSLIYFNGMNLGVELFFILYGILSVFFLQDIGYMLFSLTLSMVSYFVLAVVLKRYHYQLETINLGYYLFNQVLAIAFIFYGLFLIKKENAGYQFHILSKNRALYKKNLQIQKQKKELAESARLLQQKTKDLTELDSLKNKLFSVIAHDLRAPIYALRNFFRNVEQFDVPAEEVKKMVPDVMNDLNYTITLMENLLQWAKSQMACESINIQPIDISKMIEEVLQLLKLQTDAKKIYVQSGSNETIQVLGDRDMINLVLRNLLSNAIKFTPEKGNISIGVNQAASFVEVFVQDTGMGIHPEELQKINQNKYYTTKGTASESGTGLGLMLCKEFLAKNGGQMRIESEPGKGSTFSFTLPRLQ